MISALVSAPAKPGIPRCETHAKIIKNRLAPVFDIVEQKLVPVVPGMAAFVMWRRREHAVRSGGSPIFGPFQRCTMAGRAMCLIKAQTIRRIGLRRAASGPYQNDCDGL